MLYATCSADDFDVSTQTCSEIFWSFQASVLPSLSVPDALLIGSATVSLWALGFGFRLIRKFIYR